MTIFLVTYTVAVRYEHALENVHCSYKSSIQSQCTVLSGPKERCSTTDEPDKAGVRPSKIEC